MAQVEYYRIISNPNVSDAQAKLARKYSRLVDAFADMGTGLIIDSSDRVVSFHERHLPLLEWTRTNFKP